MNIFNLRILKSILKNRFQHYKLLGNVIAYLPNNWHDNEGNNLYHYAALHHDNYLFEQAIKNNANINQKNNTGIMPIHRFIECGFVEPEIHKKENSILLTFIKNIKIRLKVKEIIKNPNIGPPPKKATSFRELDFNVELLEKFIKCGANINAFMSDSVEDRSTLNQTHNIRNHKGSALELLIQLFYSTVVHERFNDTKILSEYMNIYQILSKYGANVNLIEDEKTIGNDLFPDAMQISSKFIVSHYFISYLKYNSHFYIIIPILADPNLNFSLKDSQQNTILHNIFGRIYAKHASLEYSMVELIFKTICENPSFDKKYLEIENSFRLKPLKILKRESIMYANLFEKFILYNKLQESIPPKEKEVRRRKI